MAAVVVGVDDAGLPPGLLGHVGLGERDVVGSRDPERARARLEQAAAVVDHGPVGVAGDEQRRRR